MNGPVSAQQTSFDPTARAKAAGGQSRLTPGADVFGDGTVDQVVVPFAGTSTPETSINKDNIEDRTNEAVAGDSQGSQVLRTMSDSITLRPKYDLSADHIGIQVGDQATQNADAIAGRFFSATETSNPACNFENFSVIEPFERFCDVHTSFADQTCDIERVVEVDRLDKWRCGVGIADVTVNCKPNLFGYCSLQDWPLEQPASTCDLLSDTCVSWSPSTVREPSSGSYRSSSYRYYYRSSSVTRNSITEVWWGGSQIFYQRKGGFVQPYTAPDGWTYYPDFGNVDGRNHGVYRVKSVTPRCLLRSQTYSCEITNTCGSLKQTPACTLTSQSSNGEHNFDCINDLTDHTPATLLSSEITRIEDKLVNSCDPLPSEQTCTGAPASCTSGPEVRTIMGFPVSRQCWSYSQKYTCLSASETKATSCEPFQADPSCEVIGKTCLSFVEAEETVGAIPNECQHWEYQYRCGGGQDIPDQCSAVNVCVGDLCEGMVDQPNRDFAHAATWLSVLDEAAKDSEKSLDLTNVQLFGGIARECRDAALSTINCCRDSGWANGIFADCNESELALMDRVQAKAAVYVGTYCDRKVLGICLRKQRSYCTFNSQLAAVFQKEIRRIGGIGWGPVKSQNCAGLSLDEIDTLDWDQIDLSEAFADMMNDANVPTSGMVTNYLRDRLELTAGSISKGE
jgi:hypothetical protein